MAVERSLTLKGHVDVNQIANAIEEAGVGPVAIEEREAEVDIGVTKFFKFTFKEPGSRGGDERLIRGHHGDPTDEGPFPGEELTYLVTGAFGCTDEILKALGRRFGGFYVDEANGDEIEFEAPPRSLNG